MVRLRETYLTSILLQIATFNSNMVRLRVPFLFSFLGSTYNFQFQYGAVKRKGFLCNGFPRFSFQFQYGAVKRIISICTHTSFI